MIYLKYAEKKTEKNWDFLKKKRDNPSSSESNVNKKGEIYSPILSEKNLFYFR